MNFTVNILDMAAALAAVAPAAVFRTVRIDAQPGGLTLTCANLDLRTERRRCPSDVQEPGLMAVPCPYFAVAHNTAQVLIFN